MIKNIVFDIGNVILNFKLEEVIPNFTVNKREQKFIIDNIINSPEWLGNSLIDTGFITRENAITIVQDRTNHENDEIVLNFWNNYNNYSKADFRVIKLIEKLKESGYKIYLLSNINEHTFNSVSKSGLFDIVDGYVLSYLEHQVKPYESIYKTLVQRYNLNENECLFIDDNQNNIDTANKLGFKAVKVEPDNYNSLINELNKYIKKIAIEL
jgi:putative hydrolase of the HAD superfamily